MSNLASGCSGLEFGRETRQRASHAHAKRGRNRLEEYSFTHFLPPVLREGENLISTGMRYRLHLPVSILALQSNGQVSDVMVLILLIFSGFAGKLLTELTSRPRPFRVLFDMYGEHFQARMRTGICGFDFVGTVRKRF